MTHGTILVIDDEKDLVELVRYNLEKNGFDVIAAFDGETGVEIAATQSPDAVVLDLMLPGIDGLEVCRRLRANIRTRAVPLIMLTAKAEEADRVIGLEMGADDYLTKPFSPRELVARVKAILRRKASSANAEEIVRAGKLEIDSARHEVRVGGGLVTLTATEFRILFFLASRQQRVHSRNDIIDSALGREAAVLDRTIDAHVASLRKKLGACGGYVKTLRGVGYRFDTSSEPLATRGAD